MGAAPSAEEDPQNLVVIGASAGGAETLVRVVRRLPEDLPADGAHRSAHRSERPQRDPGDPAGAGSLPCRSAVDGAALRDGEILVAPPDRHLVVEDGRASLTVGPRENGHRPAVDVRSRTAAQAQGEKVIGGVLSGTRDDGTAGLAVSKSCGGRAIVHDPDEAPYPGMPSSAVAHVDVDAIVAVDEHAG